MGYGAPLQNQNKGYAAQEKKDLEKMPGAFKQMSTGSWMSKHISSPLAMGKAHSMAPKMESPVEKELIGGQKNLPVDLREAIEATPAKMKSDGPLYMHDDPPTAHALGNKNASMGTDGKKTIIASKMQKNYKPLKKKKLMKKEAIETITKKKK